MLKKIFIRFNFFEYVAFVLIVKKSKNEFRVYVNYKTLNAITIKNRCEIVYERVLKRRNINAQN